ncbi:hypothetical protein HWV62_12128 [Athelia sp. TMB]|nr:hypothetical protein HWV62_12128 [Athelia sp. TMB]
MTSSSILQSPFDPGYEGRTLAWYSAVHIPSYIDTARRSHVLSMHHCKRIRGVAHEFLIFEVVIIVNENTPPITIFLKVERAGGHANPSSPMTSSSSVSLQSAADTSGLSSSTNLAYDMVSVHAKKVYVDREPYETGEAIVFDNDSSFKLAHASCLFLAVTQYHPQYDFLQKNCYWFAKCVSQVAQSTYRGRVTPGLPGVKLGNWRELCIVPATVDSDEALFAEVAQAWKMLKENTHGFKSSQEASRDLHSYLEETSSQLCIENQRGSSGIKR